MIWNIIHLMICRDIHVCAYLGMRILRIVVIIKKGTPIQIRNDFSPFPSRFILQISLISSQYPLG